jgi:ATP-dependent Lon protease
MRLQPFPAKSNFLAVVAMDNGARKALVPIENKRHFLEVSADVIEQVDAVFYGDVRTALMKGLEMG